MRNVLVLLFLTLNLFGLEFRVASYNVENLFDLRFDGTEYSQYIPNSTTQHNQETYIKKLNNLSRVITFIKPDIIALQEVESIVALKDLQYTLKQNGLDLKHYAIAHKKPTAVHNSVLSAYPIVATHEILVNPKDRLRSILRVDIDIKGNLLTLFVCHFKAKNGPESKRVAYAKALKTHTSKLNHPYIIVGDLNSNYNEFETFKFSRKHNNTHGITGINHILNTIYNDTIINSKIFKHLGKGYHLNLWTQLPQNKRFSAQYRGKGQSLDHIIINKALLDGKGIEYKANSFNRMDEPFVFKGKHIYRWQMKRSIPAHFTGEGFSDHLAIFADFILR